MPDSANIADDHELLAQYAAENSEAAFTALVERHVGLVYTTALRKTGQPHAAEEIAQAVFIIFARKAKNISSRSILSGWLHQTTWLTAANYLRTEARRRQREQEAYMQSLSNDNSDADEAWTRIAPLLDDALTELGSRDRDAIVLRFFENKSAREIAAAMHVEEGAAHKRVTRAVEKLRKVFVKRGVTLSGAAIAGAVLANSVQAAPVALVKTTAAVAITKGAVATASTLTLVKGALNVMAWIKAKTALVGTGVLLAAVTTAVAINWELNSKALDKNPPITILRPTQFKSIITGGAQAGDKTLFENDSLPLLLAVAYHRPDLQFRMILPSNHPTGNFDFMFTRSGDWTAALKNEIKKQFGLVAHVETSQTAVLLAKVTNPNAPGLKIADHEDDQQIGNFRNVVFKGVPIDVLTHWLEAATDTPVINETGLTNRYDITVNWKPQADQSEADAIRQILPEQFGIELVPTNMPIEMLVVEKVQ